MHSDGLVNHVRWIDSAVCEGLICTSVLIKRNFKWFSLCDEFDKIYLKLKTQNLQFMTDKTRSRLSE
jgi:hypothetical protein